MPSLGGHRYTLGIVDDFTGKSDALFLSKWSELSRTLLQYQAWAERVTDWKILNVSMDGAGANKDALIRELRLREGVELH